MTHNPPVWLEPIIAIRPRHSVWKYRGSTNVITRNTVHISHVPSSKSQASSTLSHHQTLFTSPSSANLSIATSSLRRSALRGASGFPKPRFSGDSGSSLRSSLLGLLRFRLLDASLLHGDLCGAADSHFDDVNATWVVWMLGRWCEWCKSK